MQRFVNKSVLHVLAFSVALTCGALAFAAEAAKSSLLDDIRKILADFDDPKVGKQIDQLAEKMCSNPDVGQAFRLSAHEPSPQSTTLRGEVLTLIARRSQAKGGPKLELPPTEVLAAMASDLMTDSDPFVRALGEWALAIRLGYEHESRIMTPWPGADAPSWYRQWANIDGETLLDFDYARQAIGLGWHRSGKRLLAGLDDVIGRVEKLAASFAPDLPAGERAAVEAKLASLRGERNKLAALVKDKPSDVPAHRTQWLVARRAAREVTLLNPDLQIKQILFATRIGPHNGNITNGSLRDGYGPGGDICVKNGLSPASPVTPLLRKRLGQGHVRGMDLNWDADRIVFSYLRQPNYDFTKDAVSENTERGRSETAHLYEMNVDGSGLRLLTSALHNSDIEPCYLPNGDLVFASDRSNYGSQCSGMLHQDKMIVNLFRSAPDGTNIRWLSNNKDFDRHPRVMENGHLLFLHWEYQERHLWQTHTLWTCRPDGSMTDAIYKQHIEGGPMSLRDARQIPGQSKLVAVACGHHNGEVGALMLADYATGINEREGMRMITPLASGTEGGYGKRPPVAEGGVPYAGGHYQYPYPLSAKSFLVAFSHRRPESDTARNFGLYYVDVWGNMELIHRDKFISVAYLQPLRSTPRPPVLPDMPFAGKTAAPGGQRHATVYMANVDNNMPGVKPGTVKYLRIAQHLPWPSVRDEDKACGYNHLHASPSGAWTPMFGIWDWSPARSIGIVPVEADGSANFKVPVDQPVYFQALDENFVEVRRMRSNVSFQQGEYRGCVGCHETQAIAPPPVSLALPLAMKRDASMPEPPSWGNRDVPSFVRDVQPVFDRHCVRCHGTEKPDGGLEFTGREVGDFAQSYRTLFGVKPEDQTPVASADAWMYLYPKRALPSFDKEYFKAAAAGKAAGQLVSLADRFDKADISMPYQFGSSRSKLVTTLLTDKTHRDEVKMPRTDWVALLTWIDLNAPYFDTFANKDTAVGKSPATWVRVRFPDPWQAPPAGEWVWENPTTVKLKAK